MRTFILALFILLASSAFAEDNQQYYKQQFDEGNSLYEKGDYEAALEAYLKIDEAGLNSTEHLFNIGNVYFKLGELPSCILYYEKALKLSPDDKDILYNLEIANSMITDRVEPLPSFFLNKLWTSVLTTFPLDTWAWITVILFFLISISFFTYKMTVKVGIKKIFFFISALLFAFVIFSIAFAETLKSNNEKDIYGIVFSPTVNLRSEPKSGSTKLYVIHEGLKVKILENQKDWIKVSLADGNIGWINSSDVKEI